MAEYTKEQVEDLTRALERGAERQIATRSSAVKGVAAERDLLSSAESARNLLVKAVKGEKEMLNTVFGERDCEKIGRLRHVLDTVELSDMHAKDQRWGHLKEIVEIIETVLKDLGTFKPWVPPSVKPPERIAYKGLRRRLSPGRRVNLKPEFAGGEGGVTFEVEPPLPAALELSPTTGAITGALQPGQLVDETTYVVTARNDAGEASVELVFGVKETPPQKVTYPSVKAELLAGEKVRWEPSVEGGFPTSWSVEPALPAGLVLDPATGVIQGAGTEGEESVAYKVAAANSGGQALASLEFGVRAAAPRPPAYPCPEEGGVYPLGGSLELVPEATLGCTFSISPQLPAGLRIDAETGVISGEPSEVAEMAVYEVTVRNAGGEAKATINFEIKQFSPSSLSYPEVVESLFTGYDVTLTPEVAGGPISWTVEPELPAGLSLDPSTGIISGAPSEVVPSGTWTVSASNAAGETSCELKFSVDLAPPSRLSFPTLEKDIAFLVPMTAVEPSVKGQVDEYSVSPELPAGIVLDAKTGVISGEPSQVAEEATYTVTASNTSGSTSSTLTFAVKRRPPSSLKYPTIEESLSIGENVEFQPEVVGIVEKFSVAPDLPRGLRLHASKGTITGSPTAEAAEATYVITASNEAGEISEEATFAVVLPPPGDLSYPMARPEYAVGDSLLVEPQLEPSFGCTFTVDPALPEGFELDPKTGVISGEPVAVAEECTYNVTAQNSSGSTVAELIFEVVETLGSDQVAGSINKDFAAKIEAVEDLAELLPEPSKSMQFGDWMIWMVHRAYLNDPTLSDFNFNNMHMPEPHIEGRIAPKLVKAMETNTYIQCLSLVNSNLMKAQGLELAVSLRNNKSLRTLNLESNNLDSQAVREIVEGIRANSSCRLEHLRVSPQKQVGSFFGRPVEEAIGLMMEKNESITKLGFECNDAHWRNIIDRALLRNNDFARKRRRRSTLSPEEHVAAEEKSLRRLVLQEAPSVPVSEIFHQDTNPNNPVFRRFVSEQKRIPTMSQLQNFAKNSGNALKYSTVAPLIKECRSRLLEAAVNKQVKVADIFEVDLSGDMRSWSEQNGNWSLDIWASDGKRYAYKTNTEPAFLISDAWAEWLQDGS